MVIHKSQGSVFALFLILLSSMVFCGLPIRHNPQIEHKVGKVSCYEVDQNSTQVIPNSNSHLKESVKHSVCELNKFQETNRTHIFALR